MFDYDLLDDLSLESTLDGELISLPVPNLTNDGTLLDCFFFFSVDSRTNRPEKPSGYLVVDMKRMKYERFNDTALFNGIVFQTESFTPPNNMDSAYDEAESIYGTVRDEVLHETAGEAAYRYAELVEQISPSCLMPYYRALCPKIFSAKDTERSNPT